jgi:hypothetical protein
MLDDWTSLQQLLTGGVAAMLVLAAVFTVIPGVRYWWSDRRIKRLIGRLGVARLQNAVLPDGLGGSVYIEQLLLTPQGLLLVGVKTFRGTIFAAENIDYWTQVIGRRSFKFANPLSRLENDAQAIRGLFPKMPVEARVVFSRDSVFPKGKPDAVYSYSQLRDKAKAAEGVDDVPPRLQQQWQQLLNQAQPATKRERQMMQNRIPLMPFLMGAFFLLLALLWIAWRIQWPASIWS